ncbi:MAG: hypothetical protein WCI39_13580 [Gallionellaceae bacterium]
MRNCNEHLQVCGTDVNLPVSQRKVLRVVIVTNALAHAAVGRGKKSRSASKIGDKKASEEAFCFSATEIYFVMSVFTISPIIAIFNALTMPTIQAAH